MFMMATRQPQQQHQPPSSTTHRLVEPNLNGVGAIEPAWFYSLERIRRYSPSRVHDISYAKEMNILQQSCAFIRDVAERYNQLQPTNRLSNLCITVALVRLRRFFLVHSLDTFEPWVSGKVRVYTFDSLARFDLGCWRCGALCKLKNRRMSGAPRINNSRRLSNSYRSRAARSRMESGVHSSARAL